MIPAAINLIPYSPSFLKLEHFMSLLPKNVDMSPPFAFFIS